MIKIFRFKNNLYFFVTSFIMLGCDLADIKADNSDEYIELSFKGEKYKLEKSPGSGTYFGFNIPDTEPLIIFRGHNDLINLSFSFSENHIKTYNSFPFVVSHEFDRSFKNKKFSPEECGLSVEIEDNLKGLSEIFYNKLTEKSNIEKIAIDNFEFKEGGKIEGSITTFIYGYNNSNKNMVEKINIIFSLNYKTAR